MKRVFILTVISFLASTTLSTAQGQSVVQSQRKNVQVSRGVFIDANNNGICDNFGVYGRQGQGNGGRLGYGFRAGREVSETHLIVNRQGLMQGKGCGSGPSYGSGLGPGRGRGLSPGGRRFVDADKNGICDLYETTVKKD